MNIFFTDKDPIISAKNLCNRHCSSMVKESFQMLKIPFKLQGIQEFGKTSYVNHPCSVWCRESKQNYKWLLTHALAQADIYKMRYKREHESEKQINWAVDNYSRLSFPKSELTPIARCFSQFKEELDRTEPDPIAAYRSFYKLDKESFARWPDTESIPDWWISKEDKWIDKNFVNGKYTKR